MGIRVENYFGFYGTSNEPSEVIGLMSVDFNRISDDQIITYDPRNNPLVKKFHPALVATPDAHRISDKSLSKLEKCQ
jgi:hypothetical protein